MAGKVDIPKFKDYRNKVKRHPWKKFPPLPLKGKTTIAIHHSLTKRSLDGSNAEGYAKFHVDTHGWPSIGYSYVIEPDGTVKWCNDIELRTYHVGNHNNYAVGVCLTGDFRTEEPTKEQKESLRNLVSALQKKYTHLKYVKGHNEFSGYEWKACPEFDYKSVLNEKGGSGGTVEAPDQATAKGKRLESKVDGLRFYSKPSWSDKYVVGHANKGVGFPTIVRKLKVGNGHQYEVKNSKGASYYITASSKYVKVEGEGKGASGGSKPASKPSNSNKSKPAPSKYVYLPKSAETWRTYKLNVQPVKKNSDWSLTPARYGGLKYEILDEPYPNVVTIKTGRGKRNIYVAPSTGAKIK